MGSAPLHTSRSTPQEATSHLRTNQSPDQAHIKISLQILLTSFNLPSSDHFPETQHLTTHINKSYKIYNLYKSALILVPVASNNTQEMAEASYLTSWMCWRRNSFSSLSSPSHSSSPPRPPTPPRPGRGWWSWCTSLWAPPPSLPWPPPLPLHPALLLRAGEGDRLPLVVPEL